MLVAIAILLHGALLLRPNTPFNFKLVAGGVIGCIVLFSLATSYYVIIRYPYLSLIPTQDGDELDRQRVSPTLVRVLKVLSLLAFALCFLALASQLWMNGPKNLAQLIAVPYCGIMAVFVSYLTWFYDPIAHPTVATFFRATLGIGVVFVPLFIPALIIGSLRCRTMLAQADMLQE